MTNANDARKAHKILDDLFKGNMVLDEEREFLRRALPEQPKQKTLAGIIAHVDDAWSVASDNDWGGNSYDPDVSIEDWLTELHEQLKGLIDTPATVPALPAGMRIAEHEDYGRVVAAPIADSDGERMIFCLDKTSLTGAGRCWAHEDSLTFIAAEPDKSAHPEFLETEADYKDAPDGTTVARGSSSPWVKQGTVWENVAFDGKFSKDLASVPRRVLRWGE